MELSRTSRAFINELVLQAPLSALLLNDMRELQGIQSPGPRENESKALKTAKTLKLFSHFQCQFQCHSTGSLEVATR